MSRTTIMAIGATIGALWIAMALASLWSAFQGLQNGRSDWFLGWGLVGVLLLLAGTSAVVGTWIHQYRLKDH
ncbi:MAG TPA: hypothetical protein VMK65_04905 [Longimicrobiales bacterium]|nr:hypothetical protein [Longimicrobiales bacterium]